MPILNEEKISYCGTVQTREEAYRNTVHEENKQKYLNILYSVLLNGNFDQ